MRFLSSQRSADNPKGLDPAAFCAHTWQQHPALFRGAFPGSECPLSAEELAGIALLDEAESRLIIHQPADEHWQLRHGPFEEDDFLQLPEQHWTLLVQQCERFVPELRSLQQAFDFLPRWRMDDVMVSYAAPHGSVGAHVDQYDVFLLQLSGERHWSIATEFDPRLLPDQDQAVLAAFVPEQSWTLQPGDMLYLPPGVAHHGVAAAGGDPCLTASIGFRAPSKSDLLFQLAEDALNNSGEDRFADPARTPVSRPGQIGAADLQRLRDWMQQSLEVDAAELAASFGRLLTRTHRDHNEAPVSFSGAGSDMLRLVARPDCRWAWYTPEDDASEDGRALLFCNGETYPMPASCAEALVASGMQGQHISLDCSTLTDTQRQSLETLISEGHVLISDGDP